MAIRFRKGRKSPWQVYWNNPITGVRESESFATEHEAKKNDSLIKHRIMFERESFAPQEEEQANIITLEDCYLLYLKEKKFSKKGLSWQMDAMREPLTAFGDMDVREIQRSHIEPLIQKMLATKVKPVTVRGRFSVLRTVLRWCADKGYREPIVFPKLPSAVYEKLVPPSPEELSSIISVSPQHIVRIVIIGAQCGVRVGPSEMFRLTWADVDFQRGVLHVEGAKKNARSPWREVPIRDELLDVMMAWKTEDDSKGCQYIINYGGKPISSNVKHAWLCSLRKAGITRRIRLYDLRHAFATNLIAAGVDVGTVAKLMGHSSPNMIFQHYQYVLDGQKKAAVESLPEISYVPKSMCPKKTGPQKFLQPFDFIGVPDRN